jgi:hypothetical protein
MAGTCQCAHGIKPVKVNKIQFQCFLVEFWDGKSNQTSSIASIQVHAPAHWNADTFLGIC